MENGPDLEYFASLQAKAQKAKDDFASHKTFAPAESQPREEEGWSEIDRVVKPVFERAVLEQMRAQRRQAQETAAKEQYAQLEDWYKQQGQTSSEQAAQMEIGKAENKIAKNSQTASRFAAFIDKGVQNGVVSQEEIDSWEAKAKVKIQEEEARQIAAAAETVEQEVLNRASQEIDVAIIDLGKLAEKMLQLKHWDVQVVLNNVDDIIFRLNAIGSKIGRNWMDLVVAVQGGMSLIDQITSLRAQATNTPA